MPRGSQKAKLTLSKEARDQLQKTAQSRTSPVREVQRANILLRYSEGMSITDIQKAVHVSRPSIYRWKEKAVAMGNRSSTVVGTRFADT